ncbi:hypothetical protein AAMO2058_000535500 [Amorphochlora amoebiformis]
MASAKKKDDAGSPDNSDEFKATKWRVGVVQMTSCSDPEKNIKFAQFMCEEASKQGVKMVCFPENFAFMGLSSIESQKFSQPLNGKVISEYCQLAKKFGLFLSLGGFQEKRPNRPKIHNTHILVDPSGSIVGKYRKAHLFDVDVPNGQSFRESAFTEPGKSMALARTPLGNFGITVCYDIRFPEMYCSLRRAGANILLIPAAFAMKTGRAHWEVLLRARAIENQCYVIAAAQCGKHNVDRYHNETKKAPRESYGDACVIDPWGTVIARGVEGTPGLREKTEMQRGAGGRE